MTNRNAALLGPDAEEFQPERWTCGGDRAAVESNCGFLTFLVGIRGLLAGVVNRFEFKKGGKREVV